MRPKSVEAGVDRRLDRLEESSSEGVDAVQCDDGAGIKSSHTSHAAEAGVLQFAEVEFIQLWNEVVEELLVW